VESEAQTNSLTDQLAKLAKLHTDGVLSDDDFRALKTKIIGQVSGNNRFEGRRSKSKPVKGDPSINQQASSNGLFEAVVISLILIFISIVVGKSLGPSGLWTTIVLFAPIILKLFGVGAHPVRLKNEYTGQIRTGYWGFSWTYLIFGFWVPLIRGELGIAALHLFFTLVTAGLWQLIVCFLYNKQYSNRLIADGFRFNDSALVNRKAAFEIGVDL
jgi:hypothetical protein